MSTTYPVVVDLIGRTDPSAADTHFSVDGTVTDDGCNVTITLDPAFVMPAGTWFLNGYQRVEAPERVTPDTPVSGGLTPSRG